MDLYLGITLCLKQKIKKKNIKPKYSVTKPVASTFWYKF